MKGSIKKTKIIASVLFVLAILAGMLVPAMSVSAGTGYSPITVWLGTSSVTVSADDYATLLATYPKTITGTYNSTNTFSYTGVPIYRIMEFAFPAISSLTGYSVLTADSGDYKVIYGPNVIDNTLVKGNDNLIIATSGTLNGTPGSNFPRAACSTFSAGNRFNNNVATMKLQYAIQAPAPANGTITPASGWFSGPANPWTNSSPPALSVDYNGSQTFNFTPAAGYHIDSLSIDGAPVPAAYSYSFTSVAANHTIAPTFSVYPAWTLPIIKGDTTFNMTQAEFEGMTQSTISVTDMHGTHSWSGVPVWKLAAKNDGDGDPAAFNETLATFNYSVKASSTGLSPYVRCIGPTSSGNVLAHNDNIIIANKMDGYPIPSGTGPLKVAGVDLISSRFVSELASIELVYTITVATPVNGTIVPVSNDIDRDGIVGVKMGADQTFNLTPASGYHVASITTDGGPQTSGSSYTFDNVNANHTIAATFTSTAVTTWNITVSAGANGSIIPAGTDGVVKVNDGANQSFTINPNTGYHVASLSVDGSAVNLAKSYTFNNVTSNHTLAATFAAGTQDWPLQMVGYSTVNVTQSDFELMAAAHPSNVYASIDKNTGNPDGNQWKGLALWRLIGLVDGSGGTVSNPTTFNIALAGTYTLKLTSADGTTKEVAPPYTGFSFQSPTEDLFVANKVQLAGSAEWTNLPLGKPGDTRLWFPLIDTGSGITGNSNRVSALVKVELLNLVASWNITTSTDGNGTATANPTMVTTGGSSTVTITPNDGYAIAVVTDNGTNVTDQVVNGVYTLTGINTNHTIAVTFSLVPSINLSISPSSQTVVAGNIFNISVNLDTNIATRGWQLNIDFDPAKLQAVGVTEGGFLKDWASAHGDSTMAGFTPVIDNAGGHIRNIAFAIVGTSDLGGPTGEGTLCNVSFVGTFHSATANIALSSVVVSDVNGNSLPDVQTSGASVTINLLPTVHLTTGWNTFSTPISLDPTQNLLSDILKDSGCDIVYRFDPATQLWAIPATNYVLRPCDALYLHLPAPHDFTLTVNPNMTFPPSLGLQSGWNLVSLASLNAMKASEALISVDQVEGGLPGYVQVISPALGSQPGWVYVKGKTISDSGASGWMQPFLGYWIYMINSGAIAGFTVTP